MNDIKFSSLLELYNRIKPALHSKEKELHLAGYKFISSDDIFNYLKNNKWSKEENLTLDELVSDILLTPNEEFLNYMHDLILKDKESINKKDIL
jgi:hypothetical protein